MTKDEIKFSKINLSKFKDAETIEHNGKRGVFIPIEPNFLTEARNNCVYADFVHFKTHKLKPFSHNSVLSVDKDFRKIRDWTLGGIKLE